MENISSSSLLLGGEEEEEDQQHQQMDLPPGFRFHPTDEELISHYLRPKVVDSTFSARAMGEVDLNKSEPWELPDLAKMGEKEWYFFCMRDRKYPTGLRTNRATQAGYWKATGKDKEITRGKSLVGMKKTLVFYKGRAPKGEKSNWVMHEYRLDGQFSPQNLPSSSKNEWVICRVFEKNSGAKKVVPIQGLSMMTPDDDYDPFQFNPYGLPQLVDTSPTPPPPPPPPPQPPYGSSGDLIQNQNKPTGGGSDAHVSCFSNPIVNPQPHQPVNNNHPHHHHNFTANSQFNNDNNHTPYFSSSPNYYFKNQSSQTSHYYTGPAPPPMGQMMIGSDSQQYPFGDYMSDRDILTAILNNNNTDPTASKMRQGTTTTTMMSGGGGKTQRPTTVSASQDTCLSSEMNNPEISSSVMSAYDDHHHLARGGGALVDDQDGVGGSPLDVVDSFWNY